MHQKIKEINIRKILMVLLIIFQEINHPISQIIMLTILLKCQAKTLINRKIMIRMEIIMELNYKAKKTKE